MARETMRYDEPSTVAWEEACKELGFQPDSVPDKDFDEVWERAYTIDVQRNVMAAEAAHEGDR